jgi:AcrR family transcriptional regulator
MADAGAVLDEQVAARKAGRPRSTDIDKSVIDATLEVLLEGGVNGLSIDAVATRAGVARTTVYRRWKSKDQLIIDAVETLYAPVEVLPGHSLREDLFTFMAATRATFDGSVAGRLLPRLLIDDIDATCIEGIRDRVIAPRRALLMSRLELAVAEGEVIADADLDVVADLIVGPLIWRFMTRRLYGTVDADYGARLIDIVLGGVLTADAVRVNAR